MTLAVVEAIKNTKNAVGAELTIEKTQNFRNFHACLFSALLLIFITACSDSDINIPNKQTIGFSKTLVAIYSPANGAKLPANKPFTLDFEVLRAVKSSYVKIQIDKTAPTKVKTIKGRHHINGLSAGTHTILVSEYRADGKPSGSKTIINVDMN